MGVSEYRLREKEQVREAILTKAWEMVQADGWDALSIRKIAEAVNYSVPVIYDYFENKEALLVEFSREGYRRLTRKLELARQKQSSPEQQLRAMAEAYWNFVRAAIWRMASMIWLSNPSLSSASHLQQGIPTPYIIL